MRRTTDRFRLVALGCAVAFALSASGVRASGPPRVEASAPDRANAAEENDYRFPGDFDPISVGDAPPGSPFVTAPSAPGFGALIYEDFKRLEQEARAHLERGLGVRESLSPYTGNKEFQDYVKTFDYKAGWDRQYAGTTPYAGTLTLLDVVSRADQDLRAARDLYGYLAVFAPEHRFRADPDYMAALCARPEDPDPEDPTHAGHVLDPVVDWCDFPARLRQSVREAANLRLIFGQQFMVDAFGLHFSGTEFVGGEDAVRDEIAQLRAAKNQYELAEQGLAEGLDRVLGDGCYVSDFYTQAEWALLSRAIENQETAQHHIAIRRSYMGIGNAAQVPVARSAAQADLRKASMEGYLKLALLAGQTAAEPLGVGCAKGERPDGRLAADLALDLMETRRASREIADGRNVFGFDVTFTPARFYKSSTPMGCDEVGAGYRGLWDEAYCAAEKAKELQNGEIANTRAFDASQASLLAEIERIRREVDGAIATTSGCTNTGNDDQWYACVDRQIEELEPCKQNVAIGDISTANAFDTCMRNPNIKTGEAKQALFDLRASYMRYHGIAQRAININRRVQLSDQRNAVVRSWLGTAGIVETAARVSQATLDGISCLDFTDLASGTGQSTAACAVGGIVNGVLQGVAGATSTAAEVAMEDAEHTKEVQNLLLDMTELAIDAYAENQAFGSKLVEFDRLLDDLRGRVVEAQRQRTYFRHNPANDPSFRMVRDSSRLVLAKQLEYAARLSYLAARRAEYEYAAQLAADSVRISDIYRARTADDILRFLQAVAAWTNVADANVGTLTPRDFTISIARNWLHLSDEALAREGISDPLAAQAERTRRFRAWVAENTVPNTFEDPRDGKPVLKFTFTTSLVPGGLFSQLVQQGYDGLWLLKLAGDGTPMANSHGVSVNLQTEQQGMSYRAARLTQGGLVHMRSFNGCTFDYRLIAPAVMLGLAWPKSQPSEVAVGSLNANVNGAHQYSENSYRTSAFLGRSVSSTEWVVVIFAGAPAAGLADLDLQRLTDVEILLSTTYANRTGGTGDPDPKTCTRIDW